MIILYWLAAGVIFILGYFLGAGIRRAAHGVEIVDIIAQRDAALTMLDHTRMELEEIRESLTTPTPSAPLPLDAAVRMDNVVRLALSDEAQARLRAEFTGTYAAGQIGLMSDAQSRYTAYMRGLIDSAS